MDKKKINAIATQVMECRDSIVVGWHLSAASAAKWHKQLSKNVNIMPTPEAELLLKAVASTPGLPPLTTAEMLMVTARIAERANLDG